MFVAREALQIGAQIRSALVTKLAVLLERLADDGFQFGRRRGIHIMQGSWGAFQDGVENDTGSCAAKWQFSAGHFTEHHPK